MLSWLPEHPIRFPPVDTALDDPGGLLAAGGDLSPAWLLTAYRRGIFPGTARGNPFYGGARTPAWYSCPARSGYVAAWPSVCATAGSTSPPIPPSMPSSAPVPHRAAINQAPGSPMKCAPPTADFTISGRRIRWKSGTMALSSADSMALHWGPSSLASRCSRARPMPPRSPGGAGTGHGPRWRTPHRLPDAHRPPGQSRRRDIARAEFIGYLEQWLGDMPDGEHLLASNAIAPPTWSFTRLGEAIMTEPRTRGDGSLSSNTPRQPIRDLRFFLTVPHSCSYLEGREATTLFLDPQQSPGVASMMP